MKTLRELRADAGLSLRALQEETGIFAGDLSRIEQGKLLPTPMQAATLANYFGLGMNDWRFIPMIDDDAS